MPAPTATPLDLQQLKDAFLTWRDDQSPSCCEVDELITFIETNEPEYVKSRFEIPVLHGQGSLIVPDYASGETGPVEIRHTSKTLAAKHFVMAMKLRPVVWDDHEFWNVATENIEEGIGEKDSPLMLIAMLLTLLETINEEAD